MINIKNIIIGIIIAVVFLLFAVYGTKLIYDSPKYEEFCNNTYAYPEKIAGNCTISPMLNIQIQQCYNDRGNPNPVYDNSGCQTGITCDYCMKDFDKADENYAKNLFIISIIASLIIISISAFLIQVASVSGGLMFGSLMYLIYGTGRYWQYMNDWLRFIILGIALLILIYIGYKLARKK